MGREVKPMKIRPIYHLVSSFLALTLLACDTPKEASDHTATSLTTIKEAHTATELSATNLDKVWAFTQKNWPEFVAKLSQPMINRFGMQSQDDLLYSAIGTPLPVMALEPDGQSALSAQSTWRLPLITGGKMTLLITVEERAGELQIVSLGAAELARQIAQTLPLAEKAFKQPNFYILRSYDLREDFIGAFDRTALSPSTRVIPLRPDRRKLIKNGLPETIAISTLQNAAKNVPQGALE